MMWWRGSMLVACLAGIALVLVVLRVEQTRSASRSLRLETRYVELRRRCRDVEASVARLRTPDRIHGYLSRFGYRLSPPWLDQRPNPAERLVLTRPSE